MNPQTRPPLIRALTLASTLTILSCNKTNSETDAPATTQNTPPPSTETREKLRTAVELSDSAYSLNPVMHKFTRAEILASEEYLRSLTTRYNGYASVAALWLLTSAGREVDENNAATILVTSLHKSGSLTDFGLPTEDDASLFPAARLLTRFAPRARPLLQPLLTNSSRITYLMEGELGAQAQISRLRVCDFAGFYIDLFEKRKFDWLSPLPERDQHLQQLISSPP